MKEKMTVKEVAEVLGVDNSTITRCVNKLGALLHPVETNSQGGYLFNEEQVTAIKMEIQKHHNLNPKNNVSNVITDIEMMQRVSESIKWLELKIEEMQYQLEMSKPKVEFYNAITGSSDCFEMKEVAKILNCGIGRNKIFETLREHKILDRNNQPYQKYVDAGYFRIIQSKYEVEGEIKINLKTVVFERGIEFIKKVLEEK